MTIRPTTCTCAHRLVGGGHSPSCAEMRAPSDPSVPVATRFSPPPRCHVCGAKNTLSRCDPPDDAPLPPKIEPPGVTMTWGWVRCSACEHKQHGVFRLTVVEQ